MSYNFLCIPKWIHVIVNYPKSFHFYSKNDKFLNVVIPKSLNKSSKHNSIMCGKKASFPLVQYLTSLVIITRATILFRVVVHVLGHIYFHSKLFIFNIQTLYNYHTLKILTTNNTSNNY